MLEIQLLDGIRARPLVDPLYEKNGRRRCARDEDLFFVATDAGKVLGCVRYCVEADTPMLRTMMVDAAHRRRRIGSRLLKEFTDYLEMHDIHGVYCLPYAHLDSFYATAGFQRISGADAPPFLKERMRAYDPTGTLYLFMRRP
jgi:N-acetylglutamate synthase-like GNAT family acetyltransferase